MVLPAHATNRIKNEISIEHTYNLDAWLTNEQAIYAIVSYLPVSSLLSIIMSSKVKSFAHWKLSATLTKKNVIVALAGVAWVAWQWWENWEGICEVEFSLFISRNQFTLYFSCSDTLRLPRTLYFKAFFGTWDTILGALDGPWTELWRLMVPLSRKRSTLSQSL